MAILGGICRGGHNVSWYDKVVGSPIDQALPRRGPNTPRPNLLGMMHVRTEISVIFRRGRGCKALISRFRASDETAHRGGSAIKPGVWQDQRKAGFVEDFGDMPESVTV